MKLPLPPAAEFCPDLLRGAQKFCFSRSNLVLILTSSFPCEFLTFWIPFSSVRQKSPRVLLTGFIPGSLRHPSIPEHPQLFPAPGRHFPAIPRLTRERRPILPLERDVPAALQGESGRELNKALDLLSNSPIYLLFLPKKHGGGNWAPRGFGGRWEQVFLGAPAETNCAFPWPGVTFAAQSTARAKHRVMFWDADNQVCVRICWISAVGRSKDRAWCFWRLLPQSLHDLFLLPGQGWGHPEQKGKAGWTSRSRKKGTK